MQTIIYFLHYGNENVWRKCAYDNNAKFVIYCKIKCNAFSFFFLHYDDENLYQTFANNNNINSNSLFAAKLNVDALFVYFIPFYFLHYGNVSRENVFN